MATPGKQQAPSTADRPAGVMDTTVTGAAQRSGPEPAPGDNEGGSAVGPMENKALSPERLPDPATPPADGDQDDSDSDSGDESEGDRRGKVRVHGPAQPVATQSEKPIPVGDDAPPMYGLIAGGAPDATADTSDTETVVMSHYRRVGDDVYLPGAEARVQRDVAQSLVRSGYASWPKKQ